MIKINKMLSQRKDDLLYYFRDRTSESYGEIKQRYGESQYKKRASAVNNATTNTRDTLIRTILQHSSRDKWDNQETLESILMVTYVSYVVMLEFRNDAWPYEYMTFSRRIGELWDPFCKLCFEYPISDISLFVPPLFSDVKRKLSKEIDAYIDNLQISLAQKQELKHYYDKVWALVISGEIKLELDLHFVQGNQNINVDFKSGFGSNEKGNTNRLLLVATIYKNIDENFKCVLLVRAEEDQNNNYFRVLQNSGVWEAYCGNQAYSQMAEYTGFDIKMWINNNIDWENDFQREFREYLVDRSLIRYLQW